MFTLSRKGVSPVIAIVLLLMMTVAAAGAAYFWLTTMQSRMQKSAGGRIEAITKSVSTRVVAQATLCKPTHGLKGLVGYWELEEGSGNKTRDHSLNENTGTLEDANTTNADGDDPPDWTSGKVGKALEFDGSDDYVEVPTSSSIDDAFSGSEISISFWMKVHDQSSDYVDIINTEGPNGNNHRIEYEPVGNRGFWFILYNTEGNRVDCSTGTVFDYDEWFFVTGTYDGSKIKFYVNGIVEASSSISATLSGSTHPLLIGGQSPNAILDEVRIYDRALSKDEIEYFYELGKDGWHLGNVSVTVYNAGTEEVPEGTWVANLKKDGTVVDSATYNASKLDSEERATLKFYFNKMEPNTEYTIELEGTQTSTTVSC